MHGISGRPKTLEEVKHSLRDRLEKRINPMRSCDASQASLAIDRLKSLDGSDWASAWGAVGSSFAQAAEKAEARGDSQAAAGAHFQAYAFYYIGRYPCPNHPMKEDCARKAREHFMAASLSFDPPWRSVSYPSWSTG